MIPSWTLLALIAAVIPAVVALDFAVNAWTYRRLHSRIEEQFHLLRAEIEIRAQHERGHANQNGHAARTAQDHR